ncbi:hypothetical protein OO012_05490 [Rhodobacteraceae bacterium KMM 6894]|nr:hypothetical protein [Rhodobacteraceae bacterium KMM 6894]
MKKSETPHSEHTVVIEVPEAVGVFDSVEALQAAFYDLRDAGFHHSRMSLLGDEKTLKEKLGKAFWRTEDLEDSPNDPRANFVSEEAMGELEGAIAGGVFFIPTYAAMAAAAAAGTSMLAALAIVGVPAAIIGTLLARRADKHHKDYYARQIEHGGILLWVRVENEDEERKAVEILKAHSGKDVHVHDWTQ